MQWKCEKKAKSFLKEKHFTKPKSWFTGKAINGDTCDYHRNNNYIYKYFLGISNAKELFPPQETSQCFADDKLV